MGLPWREGDKLYNAVALLANGGKIETLRYKHDLPNYGVFDEKRVFQPGPAPGPISFKGVRIGVPICEDIWTDETCETLAETGAEILLVPNGSPFERNKDDVRLNLVVARVTETGLPMAYLNQVGGQDELVFDGASFVLNADRTLGAADADVRGGDRAHRMAARRQMAGACEPGEIAQAAREARKKPGRPACWAFATMCRRTAFPAWCWACRAASIPPSSPPWRSMRWARSRCIA